MTIDHERLIDADPIKHEPTRSVEQQQQARRRLLAASTAPLPARRSVLVPLAAVLALTLAAWTATDLVWPDSAAAAAITFEIRLAEDTPAAGLTEAAVEGTTTKVYLYAETLAANEDVTATRTIAVNAGRFGVAIELRAEAATRMERATATHNGRPLALMLDGRVVAAPIVRGTIGRSAVLGGNYSEADARRIAAGISRR
jgi:preprotein translocase subunit SecD